MKYPIPIVLFSIPFTCLLAASPAVEALTPPEPRLDSEFDRRSLALLEEVRQRGAPALPRLARGFPSLSHQYRVYSLDLLQAMGTDESRALLLDAACGRLRGAEDLASRAAFRYFNSLPDKREAIKLSAAASMYVREKVPTWLLEAGVEVDTDILLAMEPLLQDARVVVRMLTISYVGSGKGPATGRDRAQAILGSVSSFQEVIEFGDTTSADQTKGERWTQMDLAYHEVIRALAHLVHSGELSGQTLRELLPEYPGAGRDCGIIVIGWQGDHTVRPELWRIVRESPVTMVRDRALGFYFRRWATEEDLPVLEQVAAEDPHVIELTTLEKEVLAMRRPPQGEGAEVPDRLTPLRDLAREIIGEVRRRADHKAP